MLRAQDRAFGLATGDFVLQQARARRPQDALLLARYNALREPKVPRHYVALAALYRLLGQPPAVLENIVKAVARGMSGADAYGLAGSNLRQAGWHIEACDMFERALARPEASGTMWRPYAASLLIQERYEDAAKAFACAEADEPLPAALCLAHGRTQLNIGDYPEAIATYKRCLMRLSAPEDASLSPGIFDTGPAKKRGAAYAGLAAAWAQSEQPELAHAAITQALTAGISAGDAAFNLVAAAQLLGDAEVLRRVAAHAIICCPDSAQTHTLLGCALWEVGAVPEAVRAWQCVLQLDAADYRTLLLLGQAHQLLGDAASAATVFAQASALQPRGVEALMGLGRAHAAQGNHPQAAGALSRAANLAPTSAAIWIELADAHLAAQEAKRACEALHKACRLAPDQTALHLRLADALAKTAGPRHLVRRALEAAAASAPAHVNTRVRLGCLLTELRHYDFAAAHLRVALEVSAEHVPAWRAWVKLLQSQLRHQNRHAPLAPAVAQALQASDACLSDKAGDLAALQVQAKRLEEAGVLVSLDATAYLLNAELMRPIARPSDVAPFTMTRARTACDGLPVQGALLGHSFDGRGIILTDEGNMMWGDWNYTVEGAPAVSPAPSVWQTLAPSSRVYQPLGALSARFEAILATEVAPGISVGDFMRALHAYGHVCMLTGGQVRDALSAMCDDNNTVRDIDIVTSALPTLVHQIASSMFGPKNITSPWHTVYHGVVRVAGRLDIATLRTAGMHEPRGRMAGARGPVFPLAFAPHLAHDAQSRDFCCNANFYDPQSNQLIDVTGHGVEDALAKRLRLPSNAYVLKNNKLALRYCKYRSRGFSSADAATRQAMRDNAVAVFGDSAQALPVLQGMLSPEEDAPLVWSQWLDIMRRDGWGDVVKRCLQPTFAALQAQRSGAKTP